MLKPLASKFSPDASARLKDIAEKQASREACFSLAQPCSCSHSCPLPFFLPSAAYSYTAICALLFFLPDIHLTQPLPRPFCPL